MHYVTNQDLQHRLNVTKINLDYKGLYTPINKVYFLKFIKYGTQIKVTNYKRIRLSYKNPTKTYVRKPTERTTRSLLRSSQNLYMVAYANKDAFRPHVPVFATLTYKEALGDLKRSHNDYKLFIQRLNYYHKKKIEYLAIPEFQKRGAIHYHIIFFNLPYTKTHIFEDLWSHGYTNIQTAKSIEATGSYLLKYLSKSFLDKRFIGKRIILRSRGLKKIMQSFDSFELDDILKNNKHFIKKVFENENQRQIIYQLKNKK